VRFTIQAQGEIYIDNFGKTKRIYNKLNLNNYFAILYSIYVEMTATSAFSTDPKKTINTFLYVGSSGQRIKCINRCE